jgi:hypothetical protein
MLWYTSLVSVGGPKEEDVRKIAEGVVLLLVLGFAIPRVAWSESPCDSVNRGLTYKNKAEWAPVIARQLRAQKVDVLQSFRFESWSIIYVDTHEADEVFLFYSRDPLNSHFVTMWSGAAMSNEEQSIRAWTIKNAPSIPPKLASCFAWHVTSDRDQ